MVGTIIPTVCGISDRTRNERKPGLLVLHVMGYIVGAVAVGVALSLLGSLIVTLVAAKPSGLFIFSLTGAAGLLFGGHELGFFRLPVPQSRWQVPEQWRRQLSPGLMAFLYGLGLGPGFLTAIPPSFYVVVIWVVIQANLVHGALVFALFGLGRASPLIMIYLTSDGLGRESRASQVLRPWKPLVRLCNGLMSSTAGAALIVCSLSSPR